MSSSEFIFYNGTRLLLNSYSLPKIVAFLEFVQKNIALFFFPKPVY